MDVVYILGTGSLSNNDEIRYSLRTLHTHMLDIGKVIVVGEKPPFLHNVIHVQGGDIYVEKWKNAYYKIMQACNLEAVSDEFLLMNDDFFATKNFKGEDVPFFALKNSNGGNSGKHNFAVHYPMRIQKEWYKKMPLSLLLKGHFSPRSFYGNFYNAPPKFTHDCILRVYTEPESYEIKRPDKDFFSTDDVTFTVQDFRDWLEGLYPVPSPWEK